MAESDPNIVPEDEAIETYIPGYGPQPDMPPKHIDVPVLEPVDAEWSMPAEEDGPDLAAEAPVDLTPVVPSWFHVSLIAITGYAQAITLLGVLEMTIRSSDLFHPSEADVIHPTRMLIARAVMLEHGRDSWEKAVVEADRALEELMETASVRTAADQRGVAG